MARQNKIVQVTRTPNGAQVVLDNGQILVATDKENNTQDLENLIENLDATNIQLKTGVMLK
jgi:chaperonin cofactor prefoldin